MSAIIAAPLKVNFQNDWKRLEYLKHSKFADQIEDGKELELDVIVGNDYYGKLITGEVLKGPGPIAMNSKFGWLISRPVACDESTENSTYLKIGVASPNSQLNEELQKFWELNSIGIIDDATTDDEILSHFYDSLEFNEKSGRYVAKLPWKVDESSKLPSNYNLCKKRLIYLVQRLKRTGKLNEYDDILNKQLESGFIENIETPTISKRRLHHLPHFAVFKNDKNFSGIQMMKSIACLYDRIIANRLKLWSSFNVNQIAFQKGKSTLLHIFTLRILIEVAKKRICLCILELWI